jgi:hypothetical protein
MLLQRKPLEQRKKTSNCVQDEPEANLTFYVACKMIELILRIFSDVNFLRTYNNELLIRKNPGPKIFMLVYL